MSLNCFSFNFVIIGIASIGMYQKFILHVYKTLNVKDIKINLLYTVYIEKVGTAKYDKIKNPCLHIDNI